MPLPGIEEQASTWPTAQDQGHVCGLGGESVRAACLAAGQGRYLLGERPTGTAVGRTLVSAAKGQGLGR
ncbi:hypothetical protein ACFW84_23595 [Streptomyces anulatus]|uniref:hypothetical protein n=1 Tax=Streptomyces anulatus TaxID=1892 RepID=UPI0036AFAB42